MFKTIRAAVGAVAMLAAAAGAVAADPLLTLERDGVVVELGLDDLLAMPQHSVTTSTEFTDGRVTFHGPLARDVLERHGWGGVGTVRLFAANDYFTDIPVSDFYTYDVILALEADGVRLSRRDKGPIWLMYPLSDHPELRDPIYNARLIWQLERAEAL